MDAESKDRTADSAAPFNTGPLPDNDDPGQQSSAAAGDQAPQPGQESLPEENPQDEAQTPDVPDQEDAQSPAEGEVEQSTEAAAETAEPEEQVEVSRAKSAESEAAQPAPEPIQPESAEPEGAEAETEQTEDAAEPVGGEQEEEEEEPEAEEDLGQVMDWYILKVQSNREDSIADALRRRVSVAGLDEYFGDIIVPAEKVTEFKGGKKRIVRRKLYPGYIVVQMVINDDTWFLVRETPGIGDFTGAGGKPTPMLPHEVERIVPKKETAEETAEPKFEFAFKPGDRVKINEGTFENFEGEVSQLDAASGRVTVMITIFNRTTPVELENWQVEPL